jgi:regulator of nucleoside diphosphate kinase
VELVYPVDADPLKNRVSVLTPIGAALLGLAQGQSIAWPSRGSGEHTLTVLKVGDGV